MLCGLVEGLLAVVGLKMTMGGIRTGTGTERWRESSRYYGFAEHFRLVTEGGSVAEWLACWTQAQKGPGSNRSRDAVG